MGERGKLRAEFLALGWTAVGFAAEAGVNERTVRRWLLEEGDTPAWVWWVVKLVKQIEGLRAGAASAAVLPGQKRRPKGAGK